MEGCCASQAGTSWGKANPSREEECGWRLRHLLGLEPAPENLGDQSDSSSVCTEDFAARFREGMVEPLGNSDGEGDVPAGDFPSRHSAEEGCVTGITAPSTGLPPAGEPCEAAAEDFPPSTERSRHVLNRSEEGREGDLSLALASRVEGPQSLSSRARRESLESLGGRISRLSQGDARDTPGSTDLGRADSAGSQAPGLAPPEWAETWEENLPWPLQQGGQGLGGSSRRVQDSRELSRPFSGPVLGEGLDPSRPLRASESQSVRTAPSPSGGRQPPGHSTQGPRCPRRDSLGCLGSSRAVTEEEEEEEEESLWSPGSAEWRSSSPVRCSSVLSRAEPREEACPEPKALHGAEQTRVQDSLLMGILEESITRTQQKQAAALSRQIRALHVRETGQELSRSALEKILVEKELELARLQEVVGALTAEPEAQHHSMENQSEAHARQRGKLQQEKAQDEDIRRQREARQRQEESTQQLVRELKQEAKETVQSALRQERRKWAAEKREELQVQRGTLEEQSQRAHAEALDKERRTGSVLQNKTLELQKRIRALELHGRSLQREKQEALDELWRLLQEEKTEALRRLQEEMEQERARESDRLRATLQQLEEEQSRLRAEQSEMSVRAREAQSRAQRAERALAGEIGLACQGLWDLLPERARGWMAHGSPAPPSISRALQLLRGASEETRRYLGASQQALEAQKRAALPFQQEKSESLLLQEWELRQQREESHSASKETLEEWLLQDPSPRPVHSPPGHASPTPPGMDDFSAKTELSLELTCPPQTLRNLGSGARHRTGLCLGRDVEQLQGGASLQLKAAGGGEQRPLRRPLREKDPELQARPRGMAHWTDRAACRLAGKCEEELTAELETCFSRDRPRGDVERRAAAIGRLSTAKDEHAPLAKDWSERARLRPTQLSSFLRLELLCRLQGRMRELRAENPLYPGGSREDLAALRVEPGQVGSEEETGPRAPRSLARGTGCELQAVTAWFSCPGSLQP